MTCERLEHDLDDWQDGLDGTLAPDRLRALEVHLAECPTCRRQHSQALVLASATRSLPRERLPGRDLWPEIAARLAAADRTGNRAGRRRLGLFTLLVPAAATLLLLFGVGLGYRWSSPRAQAPGAATTAPVVRQVPPAGHPAGQPSEQQHHERAVASLRQALLARKTTLSPATLEIVERNLAAIDQALLEIQQALLADPDDPQLALLLNATRQQKLALVRRVLDLMERT